MHHHLPHGVTLHCRPSDSHSWTDTPLGQAGTVVQDWEGGQGLSAFKIEWQYKSCHGWTFFDYLDIDKNAHYELSKLYVIRGGDHIEYQGNMHYYTSSFQGCLPLHIDFELGWTCA